METENKTKKRGCILIIVGIVLLLGFGAFAGYQFWQSKQSGGGGTSIGTYEGKSREDIQAELDKQMLDSMMTISLDMTPTLSKDGKQLNVRVVNVEDNKFEQIVTVEQNGKVLGSYKGLKPGETLDYIDVNDCKVGKASVKVQKLDSESGEPSGNASAFEVEIVE